MSGDLKATFEAFCESTKKGSKKATTKTITKMMKDCKLYNKTCTSTDTDIEFSKIVGKGDMSFEQFEKFIDNIAPKVYKEDGEAVGKMRAAIVKGSPQAHGATGASKDAATQRLTDVKGYTGSHKERFDADTGKGKGIEGRKDLPDEKAAEGYVGGYKEKGTYDAKH